MEDNVVDPHDKMRARDVTRVATGKQAPRPAQEPGSISDAPPPQPSDNVIELCTAPFDARFPFTNQTRNCYTLYLEYHQCVKAKGGDSPECQKFKRWYRSLCPTEWIVKWDEQREMGIFPGPL